MSSLCLLHKPPPDALGAFRAIAAREPEIAGFATSRRAKIWELSPHLHCSIVGTCLPASELRQILARAGDADARRASDHLLHGRGVRAASRRDEGGRLIQKALDKRHEAAIRRFGMARKSDDLRDLWRGALDAGEIAGAYWALLTHPHAEASLVQDVFGDVHMLSHQVGAASRLDIARLRRLEAELVERDDKIVRQQARLEAAARERAQLRDEAARLAAALAFASAQPPRSDEGVGDPGLRRRLTDETARADALANRLAASEAARLRAEADARAAQEAARGLMRELAALEALTAPAARRHVSDLAGLTILYVGGRPKLIDQLQAFVAERGGALKSHDGGVEDSLALLPGLVSQSDAIVFPVDCVSHSAVEKIKTLCRRLDKPFAPLRTASLASFVEGIAASEIANSEKSFASGA